MKKLELLNLLGNLLNCYSKAGKESLVYNCRNYAKKLNKLNLMPVFVQTA